MPNELDLTCLENTPERRGARAHDARRTEERRGGARRGRIALVAAAILGIGCLKGDPLARLDGMEDGPADVPSDAPSDVPPDAPPAETCGPGGACCPEDLNRTGGQDGVTIAYPMTIVQQIAPATPESGTWTGRWGGARRLATPVTQDCPARLVTVPPSAPCAADTVIRLERDGGLADLELVVGVPLDEISWIPSGLSVGVYLRSTPVSTPSPQAQLVVSRTSDHLPLIMAGEIALPSGAGAVTYPSPLTWNQGAFVVTSDAEPVCFNRLAPVCMRQFVSEAIRVGWPSGATRLAPGESTRFPGPVGCFRATHRALVRRGGGSGPECSDLRPPRISFEVVATSGGSCE
jgi:hypothetical protein